MYFGGTLYGSGSFYTGSGVDSPELIDFYRTDTDNVYTFYWVFQQEFITPILINFDYQLQLDTDPNFGAPLIYETTTRNILPITSGRSVSATSAAVSVSAGQTLDINIDNDGVQTIVLSLNVTGAAIAADIQAKVTALTANAPVNQPAFTGFTATYDIGTSQYTLISGSAGITSTVEISGGTAAPILLLGEDEGGVETPGNSATLPTTAQRVLYVENSVGDSFVDVTATSTSPAAGEFITDLVTNRVTFNSADLPDTIKVIYVDDSVEDVLNFQRGNVGKAFTVNVYERIESARKTFYARVRVKSGLTYGGFSETLELRTLADVLRETADRMLLSLPDRHVYPVEESYRALADRKTSIAKIFETYGNELDMLFLEKEHTIRDVLPERVRDARLYEVFGSRYGYRKPSEMEFVDYRIILGNTRAASLTGGTLNAVKLIGRAFTGVDPSIYPISAIFNFITASEEEAVEDIEVPLVGPFTALLSSAVRIDPIIPGTLISGPEATASDITSIPAIPGPYTVTLTTRPSTVPTIAGFTYTNDAPAAGEFSVDFATGILTFNFADAGTAITVVYVPFPEVDGDTLNINIDGDGVQTITLASDPFASKADIAADVQSKLRDLIAVTPANQPAFDNARVIYNQATNQFTIVSGNQNPSPTSTVLVTGGTAATPLRLLLVDGAVQTFGLTYITPPTAPAAGQFRNNINTGDGTLLTFHSSEANNPHTVIYKKKSTIYTYVPDTTSEVTSVPLIAPYTVTLTNLCVNIPQISGFTYTDDTPAVGEFSVDFDTGVLTFNAADAGAAITIVYAADTPRPPILYGRKTAGFGIRIELNNPGAFDLDLTNISFLLKQILPAHTKFTLVVA